MSDYRHAFIGGERQRDEDRVRRLVVDVLEDASVGRAEAALEYEPVDDASRRGDNGEPIEVSQSGQIAEPGVW